MNSLDINWTAINAVSFIVLTCALVVATIIVGWRQYKLQKDIVRVTVHEKYLKLFEVIQGAANCVNRLNVDILNIMIDTDIFERIERKFDDTSAEVQQILPTASALLKSDDYKQVAEFRNIFQNLRVDLMYIRIAILTLSEDERNDIVGDIGELDNYDFEAFYNRLSSKKNLAYLIKTMQKNMAEFRQFEQSGVLNTIKKVANISEVVF